MIILYPTETIYALGVNAFDTEALASLYELKGRESSKSVSVLVRNIEDIGRYAYLGNKARKLAENFLPGPLTLVLKVKEDVPSTLATSDGTLGFRVSSDMVAQKVITDFMEKYKAPLTCTSANISGEDTFSRVSDILEQFGDKSRMIDKIYDDGFRSDTSSTVVKIVDEKITILRSGKISENNIRSILDN